MGNLTIGNEVFEGSITVPSTKPYLKFEDGTYLKLSEAYPGHRTLQLEKDGKTYFITKTHDGGIIFSNIPFENLLEEGFNIQSNGTYISKTDNVSKKTKGYLKLDTSNIQSYSVEVTVVGSTSGQGGRGGQCRGWYGDSAASVFDEENFSNFIYFQSGTVTKTYKKSGIQAQNNHIFFGMQMREDEYWYDDNICMLTFIKITKEG